MFILERKRILILMLLLFISTLYLGGCFKKEDEENIVKRDGVVITETKDQIIITADKDLKGAEFILDTELNKVNVITKNMKIVKVNENNTIVAIMDMNGYIKKGENILVIKKEVNGIHIGKITSVLFEDESKKGLLKRNMPEGTEPKLLGDFNNDGEVGMTDFEAFVENYGFVNGIDENYDPKYDIDPEANNFDEEWAGIFDYAEPDGKIGIFDFEVFVHNFGKIIQLNQAPNLPINPMPENATTGTSIMLNLSWNGEDPDGDELEYEVLLGINPTSLSSIRITTESSIYLENLDYDSTYYWQVKSDDKKGGITEGDIWSFTTEEEPINNLPNKPILYGPGNTTYAGIDIDDEGIVLNIEKGTDIDGDPLAYEVYFGTDKTEIKNAITTSSSVYLGEMFYNINSGLVDYQYTSGGKTADYNTIYYWKVIVKDDKGGVTEGDVWSFMTEYETEVRGELINDTTYDVKLEIAKATPAGIEPLIGRTETITSEGAFSFNFALEQKSYIATIYLDENDNGFVDEDENIKFKEFEVIGSSVGEIVDFGVVAFSNPPEVPTYILPVDMTTDAAINIELNWNEANDPDGNAVEYELLLGESGTTLSSIGVTSMTAITVSALNYETTYEWQVIARDEYGYENKGDIWNFTTGAAGIPVYTVSHDGTVRKIAGDGTQEWVNSDATSWLGTVEIDKDGNVFAAGDDHTIRKIDPDGNSIEFFTGHTYAISDLYIDEYGNIYSGSSDGTVRKIDPKGTEIWSYDHGMPSAFGVTANNQGEVFVGCQDGRLIKLDYHGNEEWKVEFSSNTNKVVTDDTGNVYMTSASEGLRKYDSQGNEIWVVDSTSYFNGIATDNQYLYTGKGITSASLIKYDLDGNIVWEKSSVHSAAIQTISIDMEGNIYTASSDNTAKKFDSAGNEVWSFTGHTDKVLDIATEFISSGESNRAPDMAINPMPEDATTGVAIDVLLDWSDSKDPDMESVTYDLYIGETTASMSAIEVDITNSQYQLNSGEVNGGVTYYWQVVSKDENGGKSKSDIWEMTIVDPIDLTGVVTNSSGETGQVIMEILELDDAGNIIESKSPKFSDVVTDSFNINLALAEGDYLAVTFVDNNANGTLEKGIEPVSEDEFTVTSADITNGYKHLDIEITRELWSFYTGDGTNKIYTTPAIADDGTIYFSSRNGKLYALNPDGSEKWNYGIGMSESSPVIGEDGTIYVGTKSYVKAINSDGTLKWSKFMDGWVDSTIAIAGDGTIYAASYDEYLYALNPTDGSTNWRYFVGGGLYSSPSVDGDGTIYIGSGNNEVHAINSDGTEKWRYTDTAVNVTGSNNITSSVAIGTDTLYVGTGDYEVVALNKTNGTEKWKTLIDDGVNSSPIIGSDGTIYIGSSVFGKTFYALDPVDGTEKWSIVLSGSIHSTPVLGVDGTIIVGNNNGDVYGINSDGSQKWMYSIGGYIYYASPTIDSNGNILIGSDLTMYKLFGNNGGLADTDWPKFGGNKENTSR